MPQRVVEVDSGGNEVHGALVVEFDEVEVRLRESAGLMYVGSCVRRDNICRQRFIRYVCMYVEVL